MKKLLPLLIVIVIAVIAWRYRTLLGLNDIIPNVGIQALGQALGRETTSQEMIKTVTPGPNFGTGSDGGDASVGAQSTDSGGAAAERQAAATPKPQSATTYTVRAGDTLAAIARRFGTSVAVLVEMNDIPNPGILVVGNVLKIPAPATPPTPPPNAEVYRVQPGDTFVGLARKLGMNVSELSSLNPHIADPNQLSAGDPLIIPSKTTPTPTPPPQPSQTATATSSGDDGTVTAQGEEVIGPEPTRVYAIGTPTPGPTPTPAPIPGECPKEARESRIWKISFCLPEGWTTQEQYDPVPGVIVYKDEAGGDRNIFAIFRPEGGGSSPLTQVMRAAKRDVPDQLSKYTGIAVLGDWETVDKEKGDAIAGVTFQQAENEGAYRNTDTEANIRVIVFNAGGHPWELLMATSKAQWDVYDAEVFSELIASIRVLD